MRKVGVFSVAVALSLGITLGMGVVLEPDISHYLGGISFAPGLASTLIGMYGVEVFALVHAFTFGIIVLAIYTVFPGWVILTSSLPVLWWILPLGADAVAGLLLVLCLGLSETKRLGMWSAYIGASLYHLASLGMGLMLVLPRGKIGRVIVCGALVLLSVVLLRNSYYGNALVLDGSALVLASISGAVCVTFALLPYLAGRLPLTSPFVALAIGTYGVCFYASYGELHAGSSFSRVVFAGTRYALPLVMCALLMRIQPGKRTGEAVYGATVDGSGIGMGK